MQKKTQLTGVFLKEFQSISKPTFINLEKLTFFYGPNSAGKSSIIDALKLIRYAAVENNTDFNIGYHFRKNSHKDSNTSVGIEFIAQQLNYQDNPDINKWSEIPDSTSDHDHWEFHKKLIGHKVQVEFADRCESLKVAINGQPFFEITPDSEYYTAFHKKTDNEDEMKDDGSLIFGKIKIYKSNIFFDSIYKNIGDLLSENSNKRKPNRTHIVHYREHHFDLLVNEDDDSITINGIGFSTDRYEDPNFVTISYSVGELLFYEHKIELEDTEFYSQEANNFLFENFSKKSPEFDSKLAKRRRLYWEISNLAKDINLIVEGLFFHIRTAIDCSHIKGDRGLLNSEYPMHVPESKKISTSIKTGTDYIHLKNYALFLSDSNQFIYPYPVIKHDFINISLEKFLPSLHDYRITAETHKITSPDDTRDKEINIVFLNISKNKKEKLGFQDVGSGLSYIMPILTSLWASKLSIIEQPELHLHPKAQCELGDVFISAYSQGAVSIIESHSEHILLRVLRRIRETSKNYLLPKNLKISKDDISIYYFEPVSEGHTVVKSIRVDRHGELLDLWPGGFFSERDSELFS